MRGERMIPEEEALRRIEERKTPSGIKEIEKSIDDFLSEREPERLKTPESIKRMFETITATQREARQEERAESLKKILELQEKLADRIEQVAALEKGMELERQPETMRESLRTDLSYDAEEMYRTLLERAVDGYERLPEADRKDMLDVILRIEEEIKKEQEIRRKLHRRKVDRIEKVARETYRKRIGGEKAA